MSHLGGVTHLDDATLHCTEEDTFLYLIKALDAFVKTNKILIFPFAYFIQVWRQSSSGAACFEQLSPCISEGILCRDHTKWNKHSRVGHITCGHTGLQHILSSDCVGSSRDQNPCGTSQSPNWPPHHPTTEHSLSARATLSRDWKNVNFSHSGYSRADNKQCPSIKRGFNVSENTITKDRRTRRPKSCSRKNKVVQRKAQPTEWWSVTSPLGRYIRRQSYHSSLIRLRWVIGTSGIGWW